MSEETTINIQDLFNERIEQNKRIEELQDRVNFLIDRNDEKQEVLDKIKEKLQNELDNYNVTMGRAEKIELLELLEEIE